MSTNNGGKVYIVEQEIRALQNFLDRMKRGQEERSFREAA